MELCGLCSRKGLLFQGIESLSKVVVHLSSNTSKHQKYLFDEASEPLRASPSVRLNIQSQ